MKLLVGAVLLIISASALCATFTLEAEIEGLYVQDTQFGEAIDFFTLKGVGSGSAGTCFVYSDGNTAAFMKDDKTGDRMLSLALAAKMSGKKVKVTIGEEHVSPSNSSFCLIKWMAIVD